MALNFTDKLRHLPSDSCCYYCRYNFSLIFHVFDLLFIFYLSLLFHSFRSPLDLISKGSTREANPSAEQVKVWRQSGKEVEIEQEVE